MELLNLDHGLLHQQIVIVKAGVWACPGQPAQIAHRYLDWAGAPVAPELLKIAARTAALDPFAFMEGLEQGAQIV
jgi:hypothetical protein